MKFTTNLKILKFNYLNETLFQKRDTLYWINFCYNNFFLYLEFYFYTAIKQRGGHWLLNTKKF
jgi:hypothetical protein